MKGLLDEYVKGFVQQMQYGTSPLASAINAGLLAPREVLCSECIGRPEENFRCWSCADTRRCPIPWAEVMNDR